MSRFVARIALHKLPKFSSFPTGLHDTDRVYYRDNFLFVIAAVYFLNFNEA